MNTPAQRLPDAERAGIRQHQYSVVAARIIELIESGDFEVGEPLPSETSLAARFGVARGTVRRALDAILISRRLLHRRGRAWVVRPATVSQDYTHLRSFGQWASAIGLESSGTTLCKLRGRATAVEARELGVRVRAPVLRVTRLQSLAGNRIMLKRTTYPHWLIDTVHAIADDARSITEAVDRRHGPHLAHGEHRVSAIAATSEDARLLGISRSDPLLHVLRTVRTFDGRPFEYSDDRYVAAMTSISFSNTAVATRADG